MLLFCLTCFITFLPFMLMFISLVVLLRSFLSLSPSAEVCNFITILIKPMRWWREELTCLQGRFLGCPMLRSYVCVCYYEIWAKLMYVLVHFQNLSFVGFSKAPSKNGCVSVLWVDLTRLALLTRHIKPLIKWFWN